MNIWKTNLNINRIYFYRKSCFLYKNQTQTFNYNIFTNFRHFYHIISIKKLTNYNQPLKRLKKGKKFSRFIYISSCFTFFYSRRAMSKKNIFSPNKAQLKEKLFRKWNKFWIKLVKLFIHVLELLSYYFLWIKNSFG